MLALSVWQPHASFPRSLFGAVSDSSTSGLL